MGALSIRQPYAELILRGIKTAELWSKVKRLMRSSAARTVEALHEAFADAMAAVTPDDIRGCFRHCGYDATASGAPL